MSNSNPMLRQAPTTMGILTALLGVAVLAGWLAGSAPWVQLHPDLPPMQADVALCFILAGAALLALARGHPTVAIGLGGAASIPALLAIIEHVTGYGLALGPPLATLAPAAAPLPVGPMPPNTAVAFALCSAGLILISLARGFSFDGALVASMTGALGLVALLGHVADLPYTYGWGRFAPMALHTAAGLTLLGAGTLAVTLRDQQRDRDVRSALAAPWSPIVVGTLAALAGVLMWQALETGESEAIQRTVRATARGVRGEVEARIDSRVEALTYLRDFEATLAERWQEVWVYDTWMTIGAFEGMERIEWIGASLDSETVAAPPGGEPRALAYGAESQSLLAEGVLAARASSAPVVIGPFRFTNGEHAFRILLPGSGEDGERQILSAVFSAPESFSDLERFAAGYDVHLLNEGRVVLRHGDIAGEPGPWAEELVVEGTGRLPWSVMVEPGPAVLEGARTALPEVVLGTSLLIALLLTLTVRFGALATERAERFETAVRRRTAELEQTMAKLESIAEENARLYEKEREARAEVEEASTAKDRFLAMLGHELRNPLASIRTAVEVIDRNPGSTEEDAEMRDIVRRQVQHLGHRLDDLLDVSRIARGKVLIRPRRVDLVDRVAETVEAQRSQIESGGIVLDTRLPDEPLWVDADVTRLAQIVENLLANAAKFTDAGGRISVRVERDDGRGVVAVRDTGQGIPEDELSTIFEPFTQSATYAERPEGLGLGLSVVKGLVERHDGEIDVHSEGAGAGAEFRVRLPLREPPEGGEDRTEGEPVPAEGDGSSPLGIVVIDDHRDSAEGLRQLLSIHGHRVEVAHDGAEGIDRVRSTRPDVVICDIGLPEMDGFEVMERLRRDPRTAVARAVAMTGYGGDAARSRALEAGFDDHLVKPVAPEELFRVLEKARDGREAPADEDPPRTAGGDG